MNASETTPRLNPLPASPQRRATVIAPRIDFPTWLPAMLVKELRQGLRTKGFVGALVGFQVVMTLVTVFAVAGGADSSTFQMLQACFWIVLSVQLLLVTPARAMSGLQAELESRSIDLLLLTRLTAWRVVLGKWCSLLVQAALLVVAMLPYGVARYFFGSVDLTGELKLIGMIFAVSGVVTAAALWSSALPKIARVGIGIAAIFGAQGAGVVRSIGGPGPRGPFSFTGGGGPATWLLAFDVGLVLMLCLMGAVARLAPAAEARGAQMRALPLAALLPIPLVGALGPGQTVFAMILFAFVAIVELAGSQEPMACHWRRWAQRGAWGRAVGRFVQPGWASAMEWVLGFAVVVAIAGLGTSEKLKVAQLALLGAEALIFPALILTWMSAQFTQRAAGYVLLVLGASALAAGAAATASFARVSAWAEGLLFVLPIAGFWTSMGAVRTPPALFYVAQIAIALAILSAAWWRATPYRLQRNERTSPRSDAANAS
jgi:hypothetical protein